MKTIKLIAAAVVLTFASCTQKEGSAGTQAEVEALKAQLKEITGGQDEVSKNLVKFDTLDFKIYSGQQWTRLHESHSDDIICHWPDGRITKGLAEHVEDLKKMFVFAPDTKVLEHPIKFGSGNMTCVTGKFELTFTEPMPLGGGKFLPPTGKKAKMEMCTIGIWKDGVMTEEYLYWDNKTFYDQLGIKQ